MANPSHSDITFHIESDVAYITLNRPKALNSFSESMFQELLEILQHCMNASQLRALALRSEGKVFCAGGDIQFFQQLLSLPAKERSKPLASYIGLAHQVILALAEIPCPIIAAVQGAAAGYGMSLACMADIIVAEQDARFVPAYMALGTTPDGGMSLMLPSIIGQKRALDILLFNRSIEMNDAQHWGLVSHISPSGALDQTLSTLTQSLIKGPQQPHRQLKNLIRRPSPHVLKDHLDSELASFLLCAASHDFEEGIRAFLARRQAVFD